MIIAIDGPAGAGKGEVAKLIDKRLNFTRIDTGAMYRAFTLKMIRNEVSLDDEEKIKKLLENTNIELRKDEDNLIVLLDGEDVSKLIRTPEVSDLVSPVSAIKIIRIKMVELQRAMKDNNKDIVMEGRDITTVVFPDADIKIYLTADTEERAKRRYKEMIQANIKISYEEVLQSIITRDKNDMQKEMGALKITEDAIVVDNTNMSVEETFEKIKNIIEERR